MVNLITLAPDIVAAILDESLPPDLTLFDLAVDPPALWEKQRSRVDLVQAETERFSQAVSDLRLN